MRLCAVPFRELRCEPLFDHATRRLSDHEAAPDRNCVWRPQVDIAIESAWTGNSATWTLPRMRTESDPSTSRNGRNQPCLFKSKGRQVRVPSP